MPTTLRKTLATTALLGLLAVSGFAAADPLMLPVEALKLASGRIGFPLTLEATIEIDQNDFTDVAKRLVKSKLTIVKTVVETKSGQKGTRCKVVLERKHIGDAHGLELALAEVGDAIGNASVGETSWNVNTESPIVTITTN